MARLIDHPQTALALARAHAAQAKGKRVKGRVVGANRGDVILAVRGLAVFLSWPPMGPRERRRAAVPVGERSRVYVVGIDAHSLFGASRRAGEGR